MKRSDLLIASAIASVFTLGLATANAPAADAPKMEKCFGVAKAGKNDCAVKGSSHSCAGQSAKDGEKDAYVYVPTGTCEKIVGGTTTPPKSG
jgi:uncharacterized membrane protein